MNNRKKIAVFLYIFLIFATIWDVFFTYYYSPNLENEINPVVVYFGYKWSTAFILKLMALILGAWYCFKLYTHPYTKPFLSEKINQKLFNSALNSPKKRYIYDFTFICTLSISFILGGSTWIVIEVVKGSGNLLDIFFAEEFLGMHISTITILFIAISIGYLMSKKIVDTYLPELDPK